LLFISDQSTEEEIQATRAALGLDQPIYVQYVKWLEKVMQGDLGYSVAERKPVLQLLLSRFPNTVMLAFGALTISTLMGVSAGVASALRPGSKLDRGITALS